MSEVKRYHVQLFKLAADQQKYAHGALGAVEIVCASDFDRVTAERDALLQRLNAADQRIDELERGLGEPVMKLEAERLWGGAGEYVVSFVKAGWLDECRRTGGEFLLFTAPPAPDAMSHDEHAEFESWVRREWPQAPLSNVRDLLPKDDPRYGEYCDETLQRAWVGWQARAALHNPK